ncbi:hypothetical protein GQR58_026433 [Nymphon striatum]|nr:hypothetical protein GQR58_026433 [Nymphon striatum]
MLYDFLIQFLNQKKRTNTSHARHAITAEAEGRVVNGVKGPSYLSMVADFDIVSGFAADYMHQCLLGVTRYFVIYLWLDSSNHELKQKGEEADLHSLDISSLYIYRYITGVTDSTLRERFLKLENPTLDQLKKEARAYKIGKQTAMDNDATVSKISHLTGRQKSKVNQHPNMLRRIKSDDFDAAELALKKFVIYIPALYGLENVSYNIHLVIHLVDSVRNCGPLWATSTFPFEGAFVQLSFNGTQGIPQQMCSNFLIWLDLKQKLEAYSHLNASASFLNMSNKLIGSNNHIKKPENYPMN